MCDAGGHQALHTGPAEMYTQSWSELSGTPFPVPFHVCSSRRIYTAAVTIERDYCTEFRPEKASEDSCSINYLNQPKNNSELPTVEGLCSWKSFLSCLGLFRGKWLQSDLRMDQWLSELDSTWPRSRRPDGALSLCQSPHHGKGRLQDIS